MIGVGITAVTGCGLILMAAILYGGIAVVLLAVLGICLLLARWAAGLLRFVKAPARKPVKRRPF